MRNATHYFNLATATAIAAARLIPLPRADILGSQKRTTPSYFGYTGTKRWRISKDGPGQRGQFGDTEIREFRPRAKPE
jgi:uncharacterized ParB-like nuclease family protein